MMRLGYLSLVTGTTSGIKFKESFIRTISNIEKEASGTNFESTQVLATLSDTPVEGGVDQTFHNSYDHIFHDPTTVNIDLQNVPLLGIKTKYDDGKKCEPNDWVMLHYRTFIENEERLVEDTRANAKMNGKPFVF